MALCIQERSVTLHLLRFLVSKYGIGANLDSKKQIVLCFLVRIFCTSFEGASNRIPNAHTTGKSSYNSRRPANTKRQKQFHNWRMLDSVWLNYPGTRHLFSQEIKRAWEREGMILLKKCLWKWCATKLWRDEQIWVLLFSAQSKKSTSTPWSWVEIVLNQFTSWLHTNVSVLNISRSDCES